MALSKKALAAIKSAIDRMFDRLKKRVIGPKIPVDKIISFGPIDGLSLTGLYWASAKTDGGQPDLEVLRPILDIAGSYIEAQRTLAHAKVAKAVDAFLRDAAANEIKTDLETVLEGELAPVFGETIRAARTLVDTEATNVRNMGALDSIMRTNAENDIDDPVVYFVVCRDEHLCDECRRLHMLEDGKTPRCWLLSELTHAYHKKGDPNPALGGEHPNCRCSLVTLLPGYGFDGDGFVHFIAVGHNEIKAQRGQ